MAYLLDTTILARLTNATDAQHAVAACHVQMVTHLLTFNVGHFVRMAAFGPGIAVVDPASV